MIRVLVELWPGGRQADREVLGQVAIANVTPYDNPASYVATVVDANGEPMSTRVVERHDRQDGWAALVGATLATVTEEPRPDVREVGETLANLLRDARSSTEA